MGLTEHLEAMGAWAVDVTERLERIERLLIGRTPDTLPRRSAVETKLLYTTAEARALLGVSRATLFRLLGDGQIGSLRIGRLRYVPGVELEKFIASSHT